MTETVWYDPEEDELLIHSFAQWWVGLYDEGETRTFLSACPYKTCFRKLGDL